MMRVESSRTGLAYRYGRAALLSEAAAYAAAFHNV